MYIVYIETLLRVQDWEVIAQVCVVGHQLRPKILSLLLLNLYLLLCLLPTMPCLALPCLCSAFSLPCPALLHFSHIHSALPSRKPQTHSSTPSHSCHYSRGRRCGMMTGMQYHNPGSSKHNHKQHKSPEAMLCVQVTNLRQNCNVKFHRLDCRIQEKKYRLEQEP